MNHGSRAGRKFGSIRTKGVPGSSSATTDSRPTTIPRKKMSVNLVDSHHTRELLVLAKESREGNYDCCRYSQNLTLELVCRAPAPNVQCGFIKMGSTYSVCSGHEYESIADDCIDVARYRGAVCGRARGRNPCCQCRSEGSHDALPEETTTLIGSHDEEIPLHIDGPT